MRGEVLRGISKVDEGNLFPKRDSPSTPFPEGARRRDRSTLPDRVVDHKRSKTDVTTNFAALGTPPHVTERLLNDVAETIWSFAAVYNRHTYMNEMREALYV